MTIDASLEAALCASLDGLLHALDLDTTGDDRYVAHGESRRFDRVFGGQLLAQALVAAADTVASDKHPQSLHASFVDGAVHGEPVEVAVTRVRDGRSMSTRQLALTQGGRTVLAGFASFHTNVTEPAVTPCASATAEAAPNDSLGPTELPSLQEWVRSLPPDAQQLGRPWVEQPPPLELRLPEPPSFLGGTSSTAARTHWMRLPRRVDADPVTHAALLAYASDYFLLDMALRAHPDHGSPALLSSTSLDHAIWFHRAVRFDEWHRYTQELVTLVGHRSLVRGSVHDRRGALVASVAQEVLVRARNRVSP